jgi:hypothetical protein
VHVCCILLLSLEQRDNKGFYYKPGTQVQYLSNIKNFIAKNHPKQCIFKDDEYWYEELLNALRMWATSAAIKRGDAISDKTPGIY